jgi:hypothetical protein
MDAAIARPAAAADFVYARASSTPRRALFSRQADASGGIPQTLFLKIRNLEVTNAHHSSLGQLPGICDQKTPSRIGAAGHAGDAENGWLMRSNMSVAAGRRADRRCWRGQHSLSLVNVSRSEFEALRRPQSA